jgi:hypothetical protein
MRRQTHVQTFEINTDELGFGELQRGAGWVQLCFTGDAFAVTALDLDFHKSRRTFD